MRKTLKYVGHALGVLTLTIASVGAAQSADFTFAGSFAGDDDVRLFQITIGAPAVVTFGTSSYAGGGFDPVLSLFNGAGLLIDVNDDGAAGRDAFLQRALQPGQYVLGLTQYDNLAVGPFLTNGFLRTGDPTFTREFGSPGVTGPFIDGDGLQRSGNFSLTVSNVGSASAIPEPTSVILLVTGLIGAGVVRRREKLKQ